MIDKLKNGFSILKLNVRVIFSTYMKDLGVIFAIISATLCFISWDELGNPSICCKLIVLIIFLIVFFIITIAIILIKSKKTIWQNGTGKVVLMYGDLMKIGFPKKSKGTCIVTVQVNTHFDTIVDEDISAENNPLVSIKTIHGQWLKKMHSIISCDELNSKIQENLHSQGISSISTNRIRGNKDEYPNGSVAIIKGQNDVQFFLLALSSFDDNNNAQSSKEKLIKAINSLIDFSDKHAQGNRMYIPIMGTGLSRIGISEQEALEILLSVIKLNSDRIHNEINIVIYYKNKDKLSIWQK